MMSDVWPVSFKIEMSKFSFIIHKQIIFFFILFWFDWEVKVEKVVQWVIKLLNFQNQQLVKCYEPQEVRVINVQNS